MQEKGSESELRLAGWRAGRGGERVREYLGEEEGYMLARRIYRGGRGAHSDYSSLPSTILVNYDEALIWSLELWVDYLLVFSAFAMEYRSLRICAPTLSFDDIR